MDAFEVLDDEVELLEGDLILHHAVFHEEHLEVLHRQARNIFIGYSGSDGSR